tara:strand:- start:821 stop:1180 length:360 start_codon:yes stop_codon:yes gene_type:complete
MMADKDDDKEPKGMQDPKVVQLFKQNNQRGTKTVEQLLSDITEDSIIIANDSLHYPDNVLKRAMGQFEDIILIGTNEDGNMEVRSSLNLTVKDMLWMLEMTKQNILLTALSHDEDDEDE